MPLEYRIASLSYIFVSDGNIFFSRLTNLSSISDSYLPIIGNGNFLWAELEATFIKYWPGRWAADSSHKWHKSPGRRYYRETCCISLAQFFYLVTKVYRKNARHLSKLNIGQTMNIFIQVCMLYFVCQNIVYWKMKFIWMSYILCSSPTTNDWKSPFHFFLHPHSHWPLAYDLAFLILNDWNMSSGRNTKLLSVSVNFQ